MSETAAEGVGTPSISNPVSTGAGNDTMIQDAIAFLRDPKVTTSPLNQKIQFLESKGLSSQEIEQALIRAASPSALTPSTTFANVDYPDAHASSSALQPRGQPPSLPPRGYQDDGYGRYPSVSGSSWDQAGQSGMMTMGNQYRPEPPKRDWRDFFIMAVVSGGVMYGMASLARKYLLPHLQPPTTTSFQQTSTELAEQFDEASKLLAELQEQTTDLQSSVEKEREKVDAVVEEVGDAVQKVKDGEERWREEMREMREEIQELRELVPKMVEKHAREQTGSLTDLQNDLKSLKTLLMARRAPSAGSPAQPQSQAPSNNGHPANGSTTSHPVITSASDVTNAANALLTPRSGPGMLAFGGKPSIPSWQLGGQSNGSSTSPASPPVPTSASVTDENKTEASD